MLSKDWGKAIWDLWLHNGGSAPVLMTSLTDGAEPPAPPCVAPAVPDGLSATGGKRKVTLTWTAVTGGANGYRVYYVQNGKYTLRATTATATYTDTGLVAGTTYAYVVTSYASCTDGTMRESGYSGPASATATR